MKKGSLRGWSGLEASVIYASEHAPLEFIPGMTSIAELREVIWKASFDLVQAGEVRRGYSTRKNLYFRINPTRKVGKSLLEVS